MNAAYRLTPILPWDILPEEKSRFKKLTIGILLLTLLLSIIISWIELPERDPRERAVVPERLVKLVIEQKEKPVPPPVKQPEPEKPKVEEKKPEPKPEEKKADVKEPVKEVKVEKKNAKEEAIKHIAVFDALADLRTAVEPAPKPGQQLSKDVNPGAGPDPVQRALISDKAKAGSGGIVTAKASSGGGVGSGIAATSTTSVKSEIGGLDDNKLRANRDPNDPNAKANMGKRPDENIQQGFDNAKGGIFTLYNRELRKDPGLKGKVVFRLEIQPDGSVSNAEVVTSELNNPELERKLLAKVRQIQFGQMNVGVWKDNYRMDFFPS